MSTMKIVLLLLVVSTLLLETDGMYRGRRRRRYPARLPSSSSGTSNVETASLTKELASVKALLETVKRSVHDLQTETRSLKEAQSRTDKLVTKGGEIIHNLVNDFNNLGVGAIRADIQTIKTDVEWLKGEVRGLSGLKDRVLRLESQVSQLSSPSIDVNVIASLKRADQDLSNQIQIINQQISSQDQRIDTLETKVEGNTGKIQTLKGIELVESRTIAVSGTVELSAGTPSATVIYSDDFRGSIPNLQWSVIGFKSGPETYPTGPYPPPPPPASSYPPPSPPTSYSQMGDSSAGSITVDIGSSDNDNQGTEDTNNEVPYSNPLDSNSMPAYGYPSAYEDPNAASPPSYPPPPPVSGYPTSFVYNPFGGYPPLPRYPPIPYHVSLPTLYFQVDGSTSDTKATFTLGDHSSLGWQFDTVVVRWTATAVVEETSSLYN